MRLAATLSLLVILFGPMLNQERLAPEEVGRFIAAGEELVAADPMPPGAAPARHLSESPLAREVAARHGFTPGRWEMLASRVMTAHHIDLLVDQPAPERRGWTTPHPVNVSAGELWQQAAVASTMRADIRALAAETEADRAAIRPFRDRLDAIVTPR